MPQPPAQIDPEQRPLQDVDYEVLAEFRYALRRFMRFSEEAAIAEGLSPQQHQALLAIRGFAGKDAVTVGELAERLQIRHHSAVGLIDRLVTEGFVERQVASDDRRKVLVALTEAGHTRIERLSQCHRQELRRIEPVLRDLLRRIKAE